eukprot:TRINITY_DN992_c0_g2_i1.p1 TRINITY_DN992_c0_g2~~TRINITY_DN992_c0_g2_i1.p1  ORF type:complete len:1334 (+),score=139.36 TRINITY_DN992_c0_g2_i1:87-4088(+)
MAVRGHCVSGPHPPSPPPPNPQAGEGTVTDEPPSSQRFRHDPYGAPGARVPEPARPPSPAAPEQGGGPPASAADPRRPEPDWSAFAESFGDYIPRLVPASLPALTAAELRTTLTKMRGSAAPGADGWWVRELSRLGEPHLEELAQLLNQVEVSGRWPDQLLQGLISMVPKESFDGRDLMKLRPITVTSAVYRLWARCRCSHLQPWMARWAPSLMHGGRPGHSAEDLYWGLSAELARAAGGDPSTAARAGLSIDIAKCFDSLPRSVLFGVARAMGMPPPVITALEAMYSDMVHRFRLPGGLGAPFRCTNGIAEGCPLSVRLLNGIMAVWMRYIQGTPCSAASPPQHAVPNESPATAEAASEDAVRKGAVVVRAYLDDVYVTAATQGALQEAAARIERFADAIGVDLAVSKCYVFGAGLPSPSIKLCGEGLKAVNVFDCLGAALVATTQPPATRAWSALSRIHGRYQDAVAIAEKATQLRGVLHPDAIAALVEAAAVPKVAYGMEVARLPTSWINELQRATTTGLWSVRNGAGRRARTVVLNLLHKGHRLDPCTRQLIAPIAAWSRQVCKGRLTGKFAKRYSEAAFRARDGTAVKTGPMALVTEALSCLGWKWAAPLRIQLRRQSAGTDTTVSVDDPPDWFAHELRAAALRVRFAALAKERDTFAGVETGVDGPATRCLLDGTHPQSPSVYDAEVLRSIIAGTVPVAKYRREKLCSLCDAGAVQDEQHLFLECPSMADIRAECWAELDVPLLPRCLLLHGILPLEHPHVALHHPGPFERVALVSKVQAGLVRMALRRAERSLAASSGSPAPPAAPRAYPWKWNPEVTQRVANGLAVVFPPSPANPRTVPRATQLAMAHWLQSLRWGTETPGASPGVSYLELAIAFEVDTGVVLPRTNKCSVPKAKPPEGDATEWAARDRIPTQESTVYFDGGSRDNGSPRSIAGWGVVWYAEGEKRSETWRGMPLGTTNNQSEFAGLVAALRHIRDEATPQRLTVCGDSQFVLDCMAKPRQKVAPSVRKYWQRAHLELRRLRQAGFDITLAHVQRAANPDADALSNRAMDEKAARVRAGDVSQEMARYERRQRSAKAKQRSMLELLKRFRALSREDLTPEGKRGERAHLPVLVALGGPKYTGIAYRPALSAEALAVMEKYKAFHDARRTQAFRDRLRDDGQDADDAASDDSETDVFCPGDHYGPAWAAKSAEQSRMWQARACRELDAWVIDHPQKELPPIPAPSEAVRNPAPNVALCDAHRRPACARCEAEGRSPQQCCASCHVHASDRTPLRVPPPQWDYCLRHRHTACGRCLLAGRAAELCCRSCSAASHAALPTASPGAPTG